MQKNSAIKDFPANDYEKPDDRDLWQALMADSDIAIMVCKAEPDGDFRIVDLNAQCQSFGFVNWESAKGVLLKDAAYSEISEYGIPKLNQCLKSGVPQSYERAVDLPSGRRAWATDLIPLKGTDEEPGFVVTLARNLPVHDDGGSMEGLSTSDSGLVYIYDGKDRRITFAGGKVKELLGLNPQELEQLSDPLESLAHPQDLAQLRLALDQIGRAEEEPIAAFSCRLRHANGEYRRLLFHSQVLHPRDDGGWHIIGIGSDITEREQLQAEVAHLNHQLASAQLKERRLIAQELHDSAGQQIVATKLALAVVHERCVGLTTDESILHSIQDVKTCLEDAEREIRVLSYLLHPPAISGQDLAAVLTNFSMGFGGRTGLCMDVSIDTKINKYGAELSIPLLRVFQESLTNVHRHAHAKSVRIRLDVIDYLVELEVIDDGVGIDFGVQANHNHSAGLGLISMQERIEELGGKLIIEGNKGTQVRASIPVK